MKIQISNLGAVKQAAIDLKPLTIFVGPDNTGKTWIAYALAGVLGQYGWGQYTDAYTAGKVKEKYQPLEIALEQILAKGNAQIDIVKFADEFGEKYFNNVAYLAQRWMSEFMGSEHFPKNLAISISLADTKDEYLKQIIDFSLEPKLSTGEQRASLTASKEKDDRVLYFYTYTEADLLKDLPHKAIRRFLIGTTFQILHRALYFNTYIFPTERTTFITIPLIYEKTPEVERKSVEEFKHEQGIKPVPGTVGNFLNWIERAYKTRRDAREEVAKDNKKIARYMQLANLLEGEILGGGVRFSAPETEPVRELFFQPTKTVNLDMPIVSSMVKELTPLVLYLRYLAQPGERLIIDEPEMNLHPEAQVRITEFLAMLANAGLNILVTTHSPYIVDHLINLMKAAENSNPEKICGEFFLKQQGAFIPKRNVSVYLFGDGTAKNILGENGLVDWETFSKVSDQVSEIYFKL